MVVNFTKPSDYVGMAPGSADDFPRRGATPPSRHPHSLDIVDEPHPAPEPDAITEAICILGYD